MRSGAPYGAGPLSPKIGTMWLPWAMHGTLRPHRGAASHPAHLGPITGRIADRAHALRASLAAYAVGSVLAALGYLAAADFWALLAVSLLHARALAPTTNLADALSVVASKRDSFEYGWVRGAGSAAFIAASIIAGLAVYSRRQKVNGLINRHNRRP